MAKLELGVNIDHAATLRQARYRELLHLPHAEPRLAEMVREAEAGGADQITIHLRQDRRHIQDADVLTVKEALTTRLNLEMGVTEEILAIALRTKPHSVCLVPEHRQEVTTEGGLDVVRHEAAVRAAVQACHDAGIRVSLFVDPDLKQIDAALRTGAEMVELHTGAFANALGEAREPELNALVRAAEHAAAAGLQVNAGHGLTMENLPALFKVPHLRELNIGHHLICRALLVGLRQAVADMKGLMAQYAGASAP